MVKTLAFNTPQIQIESAISKPLKYFFQRLLFTLLILTINACDNTKSLASSPNKVVKHAYAYSILPQNNSAAISDDRFMGIKLLGSIALKSLRVDGYPISELSGIAWDTDENILYAISDEGLLYHLKLTIDQNRLANIQVLKAMPLTDKQGIALSGKYNDSEGLSLLNANNGKKGDSQLIISFEKKPRIALFKANGGFIRKIKLPKELEKKKNYRSKNKALESVTYHPQFGYLTASEYPLQKDALNYQTLYSNHGKQWHFAASKARNSAITGLETLPNGDLLVLERAYKNPIIPIKINLRRLKLNQCDVNNLCKTEVIASFDGADGWLLDNFEGLAHIKNNRYLMVSDDNENPLQHTILVLFEITTHGKNH